MVRKKWRTSDMFRRCRDRCGCAVVDGDDANAASVPTLTSGAGVGTTGAGLAARVAARFTGAFAGVLTGALIGVLTGTCADVVAFAARLPRAVVRRVGSVTVHPWSSRFGGVHSVVSEASPHTRQNGA